MIETLKNASLFDLYRLRRFISKILEDPLRLNEIRMKLKINQEITYFDETSNNHIKGTIMDIGRTYVSVKNHQDGTRWRIPIYIININELSDNFLKPTNKVDRLTLKVEESVGFVTKEGVTLYGLVKKLNPRTATVLVSGNHQWRVSYSCLFYVIEGNVALSSFIEMEYSS